MRGIIIGKVLSVCAALTLASPLASADGKKQQRQVEMPAPLEWTERHPPTIRYLEEPHTTFIYTEPHPAHPPHPRTYTRTYTTDCAPTTRTVTRTVRRAAPAVRYVEPRREVQVRKVYRSAPSCCCCPTTYSSGYTTSYIAPGSLSGSYTGGVGAGIDGGVIYGSGGAVIIDGGNAVRRFSGVTSAPAARFTFQPRQRVMRGKTGGKRH